MPSGSDLMGLGKIPISSHGYRSISRTALKDGGCLQTGSCCPAQRDSVHGKFTGLGWQGDADFGKIKRGKKTGKHCDQKGNLWGFQYRNEKSFRVDGSLQRN
jgi:hypothetical protein